MAPDPHLRPWEEENPPDYVVGRPEYVCSCRGPAGEGKYKVQRTPLENGYNVDVIAKTCDCRGWQLSGIPCHHVLACCREDRIEPESLVHTCYSIETFKQAYAFTLSPLRCRDFWEKTNGVEVHPPLFTKVMGRPKKNRKKTPEEKLKKGAPTITRAGLTMHCSVCGKADHNSRGHAKYMEMQENHEEEAPLQEEDDPTILEFIFRQIPNPQHDPAHQAESMIFRMMQEASTEAPLIRRQEALPESSFVVAARDDLPASRPRVTTASSRGKFKPPRARGRGASSSNAIVDDHANNPSNADASTSVRGGARGRRRASKRTAQESSSNTQPEQDNTRSNSRRTTYSTAPGSAHHLLFGPRTVVPDLNAEVVPEEEIQLTQNAPVL